MGSSVGSTLGGVAGGIGGFMLGGPAGAATGYSLGSGLGGALDGNSQASNVGGYYSQAAAQQAEYARQAQQGALFRPVGMTTAFGQSNFGYDQYGNLNSAGYTLTPELQAIRDRSLTQAGAYDPTKLGQLAQPLYGGAQGLFGLGGQLLPTGTDRTASAEAQALAQQYRQAQQGLMPTSYQTSATPEAMAYADQLRGLSGQITPTSYDTTAAAQQYYQQQQDLMKPGRAAEEARLATANFGRGTGGLGVQTGTGSAPSNPLAQALFNARAQQDATLAAQSTDIARSRLQSDINLGTSLGAGALTAQQQSEATQRANMLQNLGVSLGYGTQGLSTGEAGTELARQRFASDVNLGSGLFTQGAGLLGQIPTLTSAGYAPLATQLGMAQSVEGLGQQAMDLSSALAARQSTAGAQAGSLLLRGGLDSATTGLAGNIAQAGIQAQSSNALNNQLGSVFGQLGSGGSASGLGTWFGNLIGGGGSTPMASAAARNPSLYGGGATLFG